MCFNRIDGDGDGDDAVIPRGNRVPVGFPLAEPVTLQVSLSQLSMYALPLLFMLSLVSRKQKQKPQHPGFARGPPPCY